MRKAIAALVAGFLVLFGAVGTAAASAGKALPPEVYIQAGCVGAVSEVYASVTNPNDQALTYKVIVNGEAQEALVLPDERAEFLYYAVPTGLQPVSVSWRPKNGSLLPTLLVNVASCA